MATESARYYWKIGDVIRHKRTGHPYLVIHIYHQSATILVDLEDSSPLRPTLTLLNSEYPDYAPDHDMEQKKTVNNRMEWNYSPIPASL